MQGLHRSSNGHQHERPASLGPTLTSTDAYLQTAYTHYTDDRGACGTATEQRGYCA